MTQDQEEMRLRRELADLRDQFHHCVVEEISKACAHRIVKEVLMEHSNYHESLNILKVELNDGYSVYVEPSAFPKGEAAEKYKAELATLRAERDALRAKVALLAEGEAGREELIADLVSALESLIAESLSMNADLRTIGKGRHEDGAHPDCAIEQARAALSHCMG